MCSLGFSLKHHIIFKFANVAWVCLCAVCSNPISFVLYRVSILNSGKIHIPVCVSWLSQQPTSATRLDIEVLANHRKKYEKKYRRNKYLLLKLLTNTDSATKLDGLKKHIKKDRRRKKQITIDLIRYLKLYYNVGSDRSANKRS